MAFDEMMHICRMCKRKDMLCAHVGRYDENDKGCKVVISKESNCKNQNHDTINHPSHYTKNKFESIDEMMIVFGPEVVYDFCICNVWKYKNRAPYKGNFEEDMKKADWYITKAKEIKEGNLWQE